MANSSGGSAWPAAVVTLGFLTFVTAVFVVVFNKDGIDGVTKAWALIGPLVGVLTGVVPAFFFQRAAVDAQKDAKAYALAISDDSTRAKARDIRAQM